MNQNTSISENPEPDNKISALEILLLIVFVSLLFIVSAMVLEDARKEAAEASIKDTVFRIESQAQIYALRNQDSFEGLCGERIIKELLSETLALSGRSLSLESLCKSSENDWKIISPLREAGKFWCLDSSGFVGEVSSENFRLDSLRCSSV